MTDIPHKNPVTSVRLPELTRTQIEELASKHGLSMANVITIAIDRMYQQEIATMNHNKLLNLTAGSRSNPVHAQVEFSGTLTPEVAIEAAKRAFGHANGVTVTDPETATTYRLTNGKAKDITDPETAVQAMMEQEWRNEQAAQHRNKFE